MPYTTRKGTGKDKGKTCVHKKSSKKKVGCTSGPIEKYLTALRMAESDDMDWIRNTGQNKILTINKLKELFKENNIDVDWDIEYDRGEDGHGEYNEYFGKFYYDRENPISYNESYFIELYEKENGHLFFQLYRYDEEDDKYYRDEVYSQIETSSKNPEKFWRTVGWLVLYQMGKITGGHGEETFDVENTIEESNELDWMKGPPSFRFGEISRDLRNYFSKGDKVYLTGILHLSYGNDDIILHLNNEPAVVKLVRGNSGVLDLILGENITSLPIWLSAMSDSDLDLGNFNEDDDIIITVPYKNINESEEDFNWASGFEWSKEMLVSMLTDCKPLRVANFNIKNKQPYTSAGGPSIMFLSRCKEWWNYFNQQPLTDSGRGPAEWFTEDTYEVGDIGVIWNPRWGKNKITPTLEDLKDEYTSAITTQWGYGIEKQLNGTGTNEAWFIVDEDNRPVYNLIPEPVKGYAKIYEEFFGDRLNESDDFDWAREIPGTKEYGQKYRYFEIIACYGVEPVTEECDDEYSHHIRIPSDEVDEIWDIPDWDFDYLAGPGDEGLGVIEYAIDNNLIPPRELEDIVMFEGVREEDGSHFDGIDENINESDELDWIKDTVNTKLAKNENWILVNDIDRESISEGHEIQKYLFDLGYDWGGVMNYQVLDSLNDFCIYTIYHYGNDIDGDQIYYQDGCRDAEVRISDRDIKSGEHMIYYWSDLKPKTINESDDLDWIKDIETKSFEKSKSYVVDVSDLKPKTSMYTSPTSEEYTKLTRADVLDKFKELGYNIDEIPLTDANYLYIEPNDEAGYWDDTTWVNQTHWVDYDMEHNTPDPTYNGKYEVMDVNDLMFLLDNKMISESNDFDWVKTTGLGKVDLRDCKPGDILVTRSGKTAEYVGPSEGYYDHEIKFEKNSYGTRTHDGYVFRNNRRDDDEDIIQVLKEHKKTITEVAGISFEARKWGEIIYNEIMDNPNEKKRLIIDGYDHPKAFNGFPIDYVVVDFYDRLTGYGQEHSGYDKDGNYVVLLYIQPRLVQGQGGYDLKSVLNHEMKHAWDDYNRLSKGLPSIDNTKETKELYNKDFILMLSDQNVRGPIKELLKYYYYLSKLETTAYMENVYDNNPVYERVVREIASKDFESFKDSFDLDINWHLMTTAYDIPFLKKFKSPVDFIDYSSEELRSRAIKVIKKINKMKYVHGKN